MPSIARSRSVKSIPLNLVDHTSYNPEVRRADVKKLVKSIGEVGQLTPIQVVAMPSGRFQIADGNRTVQSLNELGKDIVQAVVYTPNDGENPQALVDALFQELNNTKRTLKNGEMLQASLAGGPSFNAAVRSSMAYLELHFSEDERDFLRRAGVTTTVLSIAKRATKYVLAGSGIGEDTPTYHNRVRRTLFWLLRRNTQQETSIYIRKGYDREVLKKAIDNDREKVPRFGK
jgi:hypothetical protein